MRQLILNRSRAYTLSESSTGTCSAVRGSSGSKYKEFFKQRAANSWVGAGIAGVPGLQGIAHIYFRYREI